jgi:hypothetical protein
VAQVASPNVPAKLTQFDLDDDLREHEAEMVENGDDRESGGTLPLTEARAH